MIFQCLTVVNIIIKTVIFMFKKQRQFNIISGQPSQILNQRSRSFVEDLNKLHPAPSRSNIRRLDKPRDAKEFQYSYSNPGQSNMRSNKSHNDLNSNQSTFLNYVSTNYNIINHTPHNSTTQVSSPDLFQDKLPLIKRKSPLTMHLKNTILFAPNYREDYAQREARHQFHLKRSGFLEEICQLQKRAAGRYFRVQK